MSIFKYTDYKLYLRSYLKDLPKAGRGQVNKIAKHLQVNSTLVSQVLTDRRDFSLEQAEALTQYMGLGELEREYFLLLIQLERAGTQPLKKFFKNKIEAIAAESLEIKNRVSTDYKLSEQEKAQFYSHWLYPAIWLFCSLGSGKSLDEICDRFEVDRPRAVEILAFLVKIQLCKQEETLYQMGPQKIHLEQGSPYLTRHHMNWRLKAIQRSDDLQKMS